MLRHVRAQGLLRYVPTMVEHLVDRELPALLQHARQALPEPEAAAPPRHAGDRPGEPSSTRHGFAAATGDPPHR